MERLETLMILADELLDTEKKRYIVGGVFMSVSLFFGGLAITVIFINMKERRGEYE